ncbi:MAG TPA: glycoside hydrolase family 30 protein [Candidatus Eremiobacteraceae bacterium]|nr:glycoside hydrolase family 30 protein [Candidatus Eremiobacteraceae bacterium]
MAHYHRAGPAKAKIKVPGLQRDANQNLPELESSEEKHMVKNEKIDECKKDSAVGRREFMAGATTSAALILAAPYQRAFARPFAADGGRIAGYVTDAQRRHTAMDGLQWKSGTASSALGDLVRLDLSERYQKILGFGAAFTDASCFVFSGMDPAARQKLFVDLFSPQQMNLSFGRCCVGASDYSREVYSLDDTPGDVSLEHFSIAHDEQYILPMLREARHVNPDLFLLASPWSPPGWMKTYGSMLGGWMSGKYLAPYAEYLARFLADYKKAGVKVNAVTTQNEVETDQDGRMPACYWTPEMEQDFIRDHLGPVLRKKGIDTEIWLLDHNYNLWKRVDWQLRDAELARYVSAIAWHGYVGSVDMMSRLHELHPQLPFYWTEGGPDITDPNYAKNWTYWAGTFTGILRNWCGAIIGWNLILDEYGKPNIGPFPCGGLVTLRGDGQIVQSGQYWAMRHFSQHVQRGAVRLASHSDASELNHVAFGNPDGSSVVVLTNTGEERLVNLQVANQIAQVRVPRNGIVTVTWQRM